MRNFLKDNKINKSRKFEAVNNLFHINFTRMDFNSKNQYNIEKLVS